MCPGLDLYYTEYALHIITAGQYPNDLHRDLSDLSDLSALDRDLSDLDRDLSDLSELDRHLSDPYDYLSDLDRDLSDLSHLSDLDRDLSDLSDLSAPALGTKHLELQFDPFFNSHF